MNTPYLKMSNITKVYPNGVIANDNASLEIEKGEIHAVAGAVSYTHLTLPTN